MARSVRCRSSSVGSSLEVQGTVRDAPAPRSRGRNDTCRAASSMPRGSPSSRRSTSTRWGTSSSVSSKSARRRRACSVKARTAGWRPRLSRSVPTRGTGSGCRRTTYSPGACSVVREVASTRTSDARRRIVATSSRHAAARCSQLSSTRRSSLPTRASVTSSAVTSPTVRRPSVEATAWHSRAGSLDRREVDHDDRPPPGDSAASAATSRASLVFPTPPGPVSVTTAVRGRGVAGPPPGRDPGRPADRRAG